MVYSKRFPKMRGEFVRWLNDTEFVILIDGSELVVDRNYWAGDIPAYEHKEE